MYRVARSETGYSLIELMVAMAIGGLVLVASLSLLISSSSKTTGLIQGLEAENEELRAQTLLQTTFGQAIELKNALPTETTLNNFTNFNGKGRIRAFDSDDFWGVAPGTHTLAVFWRDAKVSTIASPLTATSDFKRTAVYFQKPTPTTWGVLYFDLGTTTAALQPDRSDATFGGLVRVRIFNVAEFQSQPALPAGVARPITSFEIELTFRRFLGDTGTANTMYCPASFLNTPACSGTAAHRDVARTYKVNIKNNLLTRSLSGERGARLLDQIHFFAPNRGGALR